MWWNTYSYQFTMVSVDVFYPGKGIDKIITRKQLRCNRCTVIKFLLYFLQIIDFIDFKLYLFEISYWLLFFLQDNRDVNFCGFSTLSCYFFIKIFVKHGHTVRSIGTASS